MNYSNMYNNTNSHDWSFMNYNNNNNITEPLREPVPFEGKIYIKIAHLSFFFFRIHSY